MSLATALKGKMVMKGIYGLETLNCGCQIKHYRGGHTIVIGCGKHSDRDYWKCDVCGKKGTKKQMKKTPMEACHLTQLLLRQLYTIPSKLGKLNIPY